MFDSACGCIRVLSISEAWRNLAGEACEVIQARDLDNVVEELGDVAFSLGRFLGAVSGRVFIPVPGSEACVHKMQSRINRYGCVRSERNLVNGCCPSVGG
jgi:hypothetical protein